MSCNSKRDYRALGLIPFWSASLRARESLLWAVRRAGALLPSLPLLAAIFSPAWGITGQVSGEKEITTQEVQSPFKVQAQRNMVLVRAVVRDSNGRPVSGLQKGDFRLFDNGKPQDIDQFAVETSSRAQATSPQTPEKEPKEEAGSEGAQANLMPRNYQALYFDDVQMKYQDIVYARDAADRYLAATLTPAGRVGIFTSSGQGNLDFTDDRSQLHDTLFKLRPRPILPSDENACPNIGSYEAYLIAEQRDPNAIAIANDEATQCQCQGLTGPALQSCQAQAALSVEGDAMAVMNEWETQYMAVLRGLEQVIRRTALLPGQRSVIFLSPGFLTYTLETQVTEVEERALRSNVVVNTLDPRGLYTVLPFGDASQQPRVMPSSSYLVGMKSQILMDEISRAEDVLSDLAVDTGGQFFHNSNDLDAGFRRVGVLSEVSYVLAFSPRNLKFDGRFHKLKVSLVNPKGFTLQARRGYFAPKASEDAATKAKEEIEEAIYSQDDLRELPIDVHTQFYRVSVSDVHLAVLTHLDMGSLRFRKEEDRNLDDLTFITVLFDRDGKYVKGIEKQLKFRLRDATLARLTQSGITLKTEFDLTPGTYMVRQIVRDSEAGQLSGLSRTVEIPY
jgi:VWFA-related protein